MQIPQLFEQFNRLQQIHGHRDLDAVYGCGKIKNPRICLVFMNPTGRNVSADKKWTGLKAPWLGTKNIWKMFYQLGLLDRQLFDEISARKPADWDYQFSKTVYKKISGNSIYITNLSKATQIDARPLPDETFRQYLDLLKEEIGIIKPGAIITFGNQVSSVMLHKNIRVSASRKKHHLFEINGVSYKVFPVYYPVGQGMRNMKLAREDINWIMKNH